MAQNKTLQKIFALDCPNFNIELGKYIIEKRNSGQVLNPIEEEVYLVLLMLPDIEVEGFVDLFHQLYSWQECSIVEATLRKLELHKLADLFKEAKLIFSNGQVDLTEEEYRTIDPFGDDERWRRFDAIGEEILADGSEIYLIGERLFTYVKTYIDAFIDM